MNLDNKELKNLKNIDVIFFSAFDHNEGKPNHGLFQMFDFFRNNLKIKSIFVNTLESLYKNNIDVFDVSLLGDNMRLAQQINHDFIYLNVKDDHEQYIKRAADILIKNLPDHKFIALADKADINLPILELVLKHFKSKVIILSAVNNTWTGGCSYPSEHNCDKFKTKEGCRSPCPDLFGKASGSEELLISNFNSTKNFVKRNQDAVILNVGNNFSYQEANQSFIFKDVEKVLIPLKNSFYDYDFDILWQTKVEQRKNILQSIENQSSINVENIKFIMTWAAHDIAIKRKGMEYFITSLKILKHLMKIDRYNEMLLLVCAQVGDKNVATQIQDLNIPVVFTGHVDKDTYNTILSASDISCSTTIGDAGPRTTYESAALATPVISFDSCNASDFVNESNGALVPAYDTKRFAEEMYRFANYSEKQKRQISFNMYETYKSLMDTDRLVGKWEEFFNNHGI